MTAWAFILLLFVFKNVFKKDKFVKMSEKSINCHLLCYQKFIDRLSRNILIDILCICITYKARIAFLIVLSLNDLFTITCKSYGWRLEIWITITPYLKLHVILAEIHSLCALTRITYNFNKNKDIFC
jgi:hypothetical protein